jgi:flagellar basal body P-ring formation chaperone FlgA
MTRYRYISALIGLAAAALPVMAATARVAINPAQVAGAISNAGIKISPEQVTLLADVVANQADPTLVVESMERWGDNRMKVRMNCANSECLPFFVAVQWGQTEPTPAAFTNRGSVGASASLKPIVLHAGSAATLILDSDHVHIKLPVICLESGTVGQTIRVASKDHRQTFTAQVGDPAALKGIVQ